MSLVTPTTEDVSDNIIANLEASLSQVIPLLPKSFSRVLAKALAGVLILVYRFAGFSFLQIFVQFATIDETIVNGVTLRPLVEWGRLFGVGDPFDAVQAELVIDITVLEQTGTLSAGTQLLRTQTGVLYQTIAPVALDAATVQASVLASSDQVDGGGAGVIGNLEDGDVISFANPLPNVATDATVASTTTLGADGETEEAYRQRILDEVRAKPQGGALADYRKWGSEVAGVANIYPYTGDPGEVDVFVESTTDLDPDGIPDSTLLDAVEAAIELDSDGLATRRPANAAVNTLAITRTGFTVEIGGFTAPDEDATKALVETGVDEYFRDREPFITGLSVLPKRDQITQGAVGGVINEIINAEGGTVSVVKLFLSAIEINSHTLASGEKAKLAASGITYV